MKDSMRLLVLLLFVSVVVAVQLRSKPKLRRGVPSEWCSANVSCTANNTYCDYPTGLCGSDSAFGQCTQRPEFCTKEYDPVCGCDGKTYPNSCAAGMANMSLDYEGVCDKNFHCSKNSDCDQYTEPQYCMKPIGNCGGTGSCAGIPFICTLEHDPVCGCDNLTYSNPCMAASNNISIQYMGRCQNKSDICMSDQDCDQNSRAYCSYPIGTCKPPGHCTDAPQFCSHVYNPVCGCDGRVYSNSCFAAASYRSISSPGPCTTSQQPPFVTK